MGLILGCAFPTWGQARPSPLAMTTDQGDDSGLTMRDILTKGLSGLAREVLTPSDLHQQPDTAIKVQPRGMEFELFTPGDVGVTVRYRW